jgi:hypothetical protein
MSQPQSVYCGLPLFRSYGTAELDMEVKGRGMTYRDLL